MKVRFKEEVRNARNLSGEKLLVRCYSVVGEHSGYLRDAVTLRYWTNKSQSEVFVSIWIHVGDYFRSGHARARGFGEHLYSKVLSGLVQSANIEVFDNNGNEYFDFGRGDSEIDEFLGAVAVALGYSNYIVVRH